MGMMNLIYLACLSVVLAAPPQQPPVYPTPGPAQEYNPDIGQTNVGGYGVNKDPSVTWWRRWCSRTSASLTQREPVLPRTRSPVSLSHSGTVRVSQKLTLSASVLT